MTERQRIEEGEEITPASPGHAEAEDQAASAYSVTNTGPAATLKAESTPAYHPADSVPAPGGEAANSPIQNDDPVSAGHGLIPAVTHGGIKLTVFTGAADDRLTKGFSLGEENNIVTTSTPLFVRGTARTESITFLADLERVCNGLQPNQGISTGVFDEPRCDITPRADLTKDQITAGVRARSLEHMTQPSPGLVLLDYDPSSRKPSVELRTPNTIRCLFCGQMSLEEDTRSLRPFLESQRSKLAMSALPQRVHLLDHPAALYRELEISSSTCTPRNALFSHTAL